eukprot:scaffold119326_cov26-Tisochrysis_lutea.AAC.3
MAARPIAGLWRSSHAPCHTVWSRSSTTTSDSSQGGLRKLSTEDPRAAPSAACRISETRASSSLSPERHATARRLRHAPAQTIALGSSALLSTALPATGTRASSPPPPSSCTKAGDDGSNGSHNRSPSSPSTPTCSRSSVPTSQRVKRITSSAPSATRHTDSSSTSIGSGVRTVKRSDTGEGSSSATAAPEPLSFIIVSHGRSHQEGSAVSSVLSAQARAPPPWLERHRGSFRTNGCLVWRSYEPSRVLEVRARALSWPSLASASSRSAFLPHARREHVPYGFERRALYRQLLGPPRGSPRAFAHPLFRVRGAEAHTGQAQMANEAAGLRPQHKVGIAKGLATEGVVGLGCRLSTVAEPLAIHILEEGHGSLRRQYCARRADHQWCQRIATRDCRRRRPRLGASAKPIRCAVRIVRCLAVVDNAAGARRGGNGAQPACRSSNSSLRQLGTH